jgi:hypothetical protein
MGVQRAKDMGGDQSFLVHENKYIKLFNERESTSNTDDFYIDAKFLKIAESTNISVNGIFKLQCIIDQNKKDLFTPNELALAFGNTTRSMNRILEKLELCGYVKVVGKKVMGGAGRPSRIVKLLF